MAHLPAFRFQMPPTPSAVVSGYPWLCALLLELLLTISHQMWSLLPCPGGEEPQPGQHVTLESHPLPLQVMNQVSQQVSFCQALHLWQLHFSLSFSVHHAMLLHSSSSEASV